MRLIIGAVILVIFVILFFAGGETGKKIAKAGGIEDSKEAGCLGCIGVLFLILVGFLFLLKLLH